MIWDNDNCNDFVASNPRPKDTGLLISLNPTRGSRYRGQRLSVRPVMAKQYNLKIINKVWDAFSAPTGAKV